MRTAGVSESPMRRGDVDFDQYVEAYYTSGPGVEVVNSSGSVWFYDLEVFTNGQPGIRFNNVGYVSIDGSVNTVDAAALDIREADVDLTLSGVLSDNPNGSDAVFTQSVTGSVDIDLLEIDYSGGGTALVIDNVEFFRVNDSRSYVNAGGSQGLDLFDSDVDVTLEYMDVNQSPSQGMHIGGMTGLLDIGGGQIVDATGRWDPDREHIKRGVLLSGECRSLYRVRVLRHRERELDPGHRRFSHGRRWPGGLPRREYR